MNKFFIALLLLTVQVCTPAFSQTYQQGDALIETPASVTTSGGTTTLTLASQTVQSFVGSSDQDVVLPVANATGSAKGRRYEIWNLSTGTITVKNSAGTTLRTLSPADHTILRLTDNSTAAGTWGVSKHMASLEDALVTGILPIAKGGTGETTADEAFKALAPAQTGHAGEFLTTDGTDVSWATVDALPSQTGHSGKYLSTDGTSPSWAELDLIPSQTSNSGKYLTTNGTTLSWASVYSLPPQTGNAGKFLTTDGTNSSWGNAAVTTKGQSDLSNSTTNNFIFPYHSVTVADSLMNTKLVETGNNNLLSNPSFEHESPDTGWTLGAGVSSTIETQQQYINEGSQALKLTLSSVNGTVFYQDQTPTSATENKSFEHGIAVATTSSNVQVCPRQGGSFILNACIPVVSTGKLKYYSIPSLTGPANGTSLGVGIRTTGNTSGDIYVDDGHLQNAWGRTLGTIQTTTFVGGMSQVGATSCSYLENTSSGTSNYVDLGTGTGCNAWTPTNGTSVITAVGTNDHRITVSHLPAGLNKVELKGFIYTGTSGPCTYQLTDGTNIFSRQSVYIQGTSVASSAPLLIFDVPYSSPQSSVTFKVQASDSHGGSCGLINDQAGYNMSWSITNIPSQAQTVLSPIQHEFNETDCASAPGVGAVTASLTTNTTLTCKVSRRKNRAYYDVLLSFSGTPNGTDLVLQLPTTIDSFKNAGNIFGASKLYGRAYVYDLATRLYTGSVVGADSNPKAVYGTHSESGNIGIINATNPTTLGSGDTINLVFDVPVVGWVENPIPVAIYDPTNTPWRVDANISGANPSLGTSAVSSYTGIENGSLTLTNNSGPTVIPAQIPCSSTNAPSGTTCSAGNESVGVSFAIPKPSEVKACASFIWFGQIGSTSQIETVFQLIETPNNAQTISQEGKGRIGGYISAGAIEQPVHVCGTFNFSTAGQKTLRLAFEQSGSGTITNSLILADAASASGQRDIHWTVDPISTTSSVPGIVDPKKVTVVATTNSGQSIGGSAGTLTNWTEEKDSNNAFNAPTGVFTVPTGMDGAYRGCVSITFSPTTATNFAMNTYLYKNSSTQVALLGYAYKPSATSYATHLPTSCRVIQLVSGDTLEFKAVQSTGTSYNLTTNHIENYLSIERIGD